LGWQDLGGGPPGFGQGRPCRSLADAEGGRRRPYCFVRRTLVSFSALAWPARTLAIADSTTSSFHPRSGDFAFYDHVLDTCAQLNLIPERYTKHGLSALDIAFAMGRGRQELDKGIDLSAMEMKKWFDSNYHFIVPEVSGAVEFKLNSNKALDEFKEAKELGITTRPVVLGPITLLAFSKAANDAAEGFEPLQALDKLVPVYAELLSQLKEAGAESVQIDEPVLVLDRAESLGAEFKSVYAELSKVAPSIILTTYFGRLGKSLDFVKELPVAGLHIDLSERGDASQLEATLEALKPTKQILSLGLISGRNIWKADLTAALETVKKAIAALGEDRIIVATSSSLLHTPVTLKSETRLTEQQADWLSFALEKVAEVATLAHAASGSSDEKYAKALEANKASIKARRDFETESDSAVRDRVAAVKESDYERKSKFPVRKAAYQEKLKLPRFPTTTIGSFPQTKEIRIARNKFNKGELTAEAYEKAMEAEVEKVIRFQEKVDLDLLVHGEPERNDMVQYFGEQLQGFIFTQNGWVQSYGSRCVRPPIIVSDVSRPKAMTVRWSTYAQSLTSKPVKGMLTGPVTILNWSFPRIDVPREIQCRQLALALRDEVSDLEKAGIYAIQVDEPAIREGLPLRKTDWAEYLLWAVDSFRLSTAVAEDSTFIASQCVPLLSLPFDRTLLTRSPPSLQLLLLRLQRHLRLDHAPRRWCVQPSHFILPDLLADPPLLSQTRSRSRPRRATSSSLTSSSSTPTPTASAPVSTTSTRLVSPRPRRSRSA